MSGNNALYRKQFGFQEKHSTEHAIMQLVDQINCSFETNMYTLVIFIDISKAFDTVDHKILITKLENYGVKKTNLQWLKSFLENRKQFIAYENFSTSQKHFMWCAKRVTSWVITLFVYVNDLNKASDVLDPVMFADDPNLFYSYQNIKTLFGTVNCELKNHVSGSDQANYL